MADNVSTVRTAIEQARSEPVALERLHDWHRMLMAGASYLPGPLVGEIRDLQGWIGGTGPLDAVLVTPPPEHVGPLLDALATRGIVKPFQPARREPGRPRWVARELADVVGAWSR